MGRRESPLRSKDKESRERCQASGREVRIVHHREGQYRSLAIDEQALPHDHPNTAATLDNLGQLYQDQGRYEEAEPLYRRSLAIKEKALPPDHPDTATTLNNLAGLYRAQGRYEEAEPLYQRSPLIILTQPSPWKTMPLCSES
jgi:tetratricopeptide (TPR) repeat protein